MKKSLGLKYNKGITQLHSMDRLAIERNEKGPGLTKEFCDNWIDNIPNQTLRTKYFKCSMLRQFSMYLLDLEIESYLPKMIRYEKNNHIPYIYSDEQVQKIFNACDNLQAPITTHTGLFSIPAFLRFLFATGVRLGEALSLKSEDVNLSGRYIKILDSKNKKERLLPISKSLTEVLITYVWYKNHLSPAYHNNYFFIKTDGRKLSSNLVRTHFKRCLDIAGIFGEDNLTRPRIHDFRHTFAVNSLAKIVESGNDSYIALPILSKYLGHSSVEATNTYVRLTAKMYPDVIKNLELYIPNVYPKIGDNETN